MHDRRAREPLVAAPAWELAHRDVDLHLAAAVAEASRGVPDSGRHLAVGEQRPVELGRRHAGEDGPLRADRLAAGESDPGGAPVRDEDALDGSVGPELAARLADDRRQPLDQRHTTALRHGHPAELQGTGDHLCHEARHRLIGPETGVQHPRREQAVGALVVERLGQPVARGRERAPAELDEAAPAELGVGPAAESEAGAVDQSSVPSTPKAMSALPMNSSNCPLPRVAELGRVRRAVGGEEDARAVRERRAGGELGVEVLDAEPVEIRLQLGVGR